MCLSPTPVMQKQKLKPCTWLQYENDNLDGILNNQFDSWRSGLNTTDIPSFDINSFKFENHKAKIPSATVNLDLSPEN